MARLAEMKINTRKKEVFSLLTVSKTGRQHTMLLCSNTRQNTQVRTERGGMGEEQEKEAGREEVKGERQRGTPGKSMCCACHGKQKVRHDKQAWNCSLNNNHGLFSCRMVSSYPVSGYIPYR